MTNWFYNKQVEGRPRDFTSGPVKTPPRRFSTLANFCGFEVIDHDGRTVAEVEGDEVDAFHVANDLNEAAQGGYLEDALLSLEVA